MGGCRRPLFVDGRDTCNLVPTNAATLLKQLSLTGSVSGVLGERQPREGGEIA
jgi:hypothetical protein